MTTLLLLKGLLLGFAIAAPVGPIGVLCIRRTLADGWRIGFATGLGAATADATYGAIAAFGLTAVSGLLTAQQFWLRLLGGAFLLYLGLRTMRAKPATDAAQATARGVFPAYATTVLLTLTNPSTILSFVVMFAGLGVASGDSSYLGAALLVVGVFLGSASWWLLLSSGVSVLRGRFGPRAMLWVNRLSGLIILGFGIVALISVLPWQPR